MSMDGLSIHAVVCELQFLIGGKIDKIQQPEKDALLLTIRNERQTNKLFLSSHAENGRIQLTKLPFANPAEAPAFCMLLRRRLTNSRISNIVQSGLDRVVTFYFEGRDDFQDTVTYRLVIELMGKYSNIILVQGDDTIADSIKHVGPQMSSVRTVMPGLPYFLPVTQQKKNPLEATVLDFSPVFSQSEPSAKVLCSMFEGISKQIATYLLEQNQNTVSLQRAFAGFAKKVFDPTIVLDQNADPVCVLPFCYSDSVFYTTKIMHSMSEAYDLFFEKRDAIIRIARHSTALRKVLETQLNRAKNKQQIYNDAIESEVKYEEYRLYGELLTANLYNLKATASAIVDNYYCDPPEKCIIALDPRRSISENAQDYYKRYRKSKAARDYALQQLEMTASEIDYLEGQLENISLCDTLAELDEIKEEMIHEGYIKPERKRSATSGNKRLASAPMTFVSRDGIRIFVGKNNKQNEQLTMKNALSDNLWFHAKNIPGSHVIVDCVAEPATKTIEDAALLAAYFSKARNSASVPVDYTKRKNIKKPSGTHPGFVVYSTNKTIYVTPTEAQMKKMQADNNIFSDIKENEK